MTTTLDISPSPRTALAVDGPQVSRFVAGWWRLQDWGLSRADTQALMEHYLSLGVTTMDHADIYGGYQCEALFGEAFAGSGIEREQLQIITKCGIQLVDSARPNTTVKHYDTSKQHIIASAERSLKNLQCEYLDVLLIHRPDPLMQADEVAEAFESLSRSGKVRHFGVSNFTPAQFALLQSSWDKPLVTNQLEISPLAPTVLTDGSLDQCQQRRIRPMAWSCLGGGRLFLDAAYQPARERLQPLVEQVGASSLEQLIYAWVLMLPSQPLPIIGSGKPERISSAVASAQISLNRQQWFEILTAITGQEVP